MEENVVELEREFVANCVELLFVGKVIERRMVFGFRLYFCFFCVRRFRVRDNLMIWIRWGFGGWNYLVVFY